MLAVPALAGEAARAQAPVQATCQTGPREDLFYREDWFGEPWRKPETAILIHGNDESSIVWYAWVPRLAEEFRVLRPDLPGFGRSTVPPGFEWSLRSLAAFVVRILDKAGVEKAHIIGAKTGGAIAMQLAADFADRTQTLSVASGPASVIQIANPSPVPQRDRLGSAAPKEMVEYWNTMFSTAPEEGAKRIAHRSFGIRSGEGRRVAADQSAHAGDHRRQKRAAIGGKGPPISAADSQFQARRSE